MIRISFMAIPLIGIIAAVSAVAQDQQRSAALKEIRETAAEICVTVEQKGQKSNAQLSGEVQAKVAGIAAKLADIGVKGSGQIGSEEYQGVSQEALTTALKDIRTCRIHVFDKLLDKLLSSTIEHDNVKPPPNKPIRSYVGNWRFTNNTQTLHITEDGSVSWVDGYGRVITEGTGVSQGDKLTVTLPDANGQPFQAEFSITMNGQMLSGNFGPPISGRTTLRKTN